MKNVQRESIEMTSKNNVWYRGEHRFKGWRYKHGKNGVKAISPNNKTYRVVEICQEVKTEPDTQSGYLWTLRAVYCYNNLSRRKAKEVLRLIFGQGLRKIVLEWTSHLVLIEECGDFVGAVDVDKEFSSVLDDMDQE